MLLVLDNCEHAVDACAELASSLLGSCPSLRHVATSREIIGVAGETVWTVQRHPPPPDAAPPQPCHGARPGGTSGGARVFAVPLSRPARRLHVGLCPAAEVRGGSTMPVGDSDGRIGTVSTAADLRLAMLYPTPREDPPVTIREARGDDVGAIAAIGRVGFPAVHRTAVPEVVVDEVVSRMYADDALHRCIAACAESPEREFLVAESGGRVIGFVHYEGDRPDPELMRIYVDREHLGDGIGTRLLEALEARLSPGTSYVLLVVGTNQRAIRFYDGRGFVREQEVDGPSFFAAHMGIELPRAEYVPAYVMRRTLSV